MRRFACYTHQAYPDPDSYNSVSLLFRNCPKLSAACEIFYTTVRSGPRDSVDHPGKALRGRRKEAQLGRSALLPGLHIDHSSLDSNLGYYSLLAAGGRGI